MPTNGNLRHNLAAGNWRGKERRTIPCPPRLVAGHDAARLAGLAPASVICEIMNDDGTMARLPELVAFAQLHGLKIGAISDLMARLEPITLVADGVARRGLRPLPGSRARLRSSPQRRAASRSVR